MQSDIKRLSLYINHGRPCVEIVRVDRSPSNLSNIDTQSPEVEIVGLELFLISF